MENEGMIVSLTSLRFLQHSQSYYIMQGLSFLERIHEWGHLFSG
jgi:hypothetical protein